MIAVRSLRDVQVLKEIDLEKKVLVLITRARGLYKIVKIKEGTEFGYCLLDCVNNKITDGIMDSMNIKKKLDFLIHLGDKVKVFNNSEDATWFIAVELDNFKKMQNVN